jgi:hypothetical protein
MVYEGFIQTKGVTSLKDLWEGNGKGVHEGCGQSCGNGKGTRKLAMEKNCWRQLANFVLRIASEPEKVFTRIFHEFYRCSGLPKISVFRWTIQNIMTLTPLPVI